MDEKKRDQSQDYGTKNLTLLKVIDAKYLQGGNAVVVKVERPDGASRLLFGELHYYDSDLKNEHSILERMQISAVAKIPSKFSAKEISAIKEGSIFRTMSKEAMYWSLGYPENSNDWGRSGKQHIYSGGNYVYTNGEKVVDWQQIR